MTGVVATLMCHNTEQFVTLPQYQAAQGQFLGEGNLGGVLDRCAGVDGAVEVDGEDLWEARDPRMPCDPPSRRLPAVGQCDVLRGGFRVRVNGVLELVQCRLYERPRLFRVRFGQVTAEDLIRVH